MARGRELFPADRGLQARMVLASVATPLVVLALLAAVVMVAPPRVTVFLAVAVAIGVGMAVHAHATRAVGVELSPEGAPELHAALERLCAAASLPKPALVLEPERQPNSWVVARPGRRPELHVTRGLLALLEPAELEAVVAHELAHLAHRDATVMTVVGGPGAVLRDGGAPLMRLGFWGIPAALVAQAIGMVAEVGTSALSRYRELAADADGAALTGNPAALAAALTKVSGGIARLPRADLREVAGRDAFHLLPVADEGRRLWRTHPDVGLRIARLEAMERRLQGARLPAPRD